MDYSQYANSQYNYPQYPPGYTDPYAQQHQQQQQHQHQRGRQPYDSTASPMIRNPFAPPPQAQSAYTSHNAAFDPEYEAQVAQWQANYAPQESNDRGAKANRSETTAHPASGPIGARGPNTDTSASTATTAVPSKTAYDDDKSSGKQKTVVRKGGGQQWEDSTLLEWDPTQFRIMVGNLAGEVTDDSLAKAFAAYGVAKARVVRDKRTTKSRGYGFVSFTDGENGFKAAREMAGKYIGSHPVTIQRSKADLRPVEQKDRFKGKNHHKKKGNKKAEDPLRANTGAHIEKKPLRNPNGMKMLG